MAYKLLIADDEKMIRQGLVNYIDWKKLDVEVIATACDGQEVLDKIENNPPDIILTDINMPYLNGIGLLEKIRERMWNIEVILISAYSDFSYAQKAVAYGAIDYILKPIEEVDLEQSIRKCIQKIKEQRKHSKEKVKEDFLIPILTEQTIYGHETDPRFLEALSGYFHIHLNECSVYYLSYHCIKEKIEIPEELCEAQFPLMAVSNFHTIVFFSKIPFDDLYRNIEKKLAKDEISADLYGCLSTDWSKEYIIHIFCFLKKEHAVELLMLEQIRNDFVQALINQIKKPDIEQFKIFLFTSLYCFYREKKIIDTDSFRKMSIYLVDIFYENLERYYGKFAKAEECLSVIHEIYEIDNPYQMYLYMEERLCDQLEGVSPNGSSNRIIVLTLHYIHINYKDNLTLNSTADYLNVSRSYLSRLFKQEIGYNFTDYLIEHRMKEAKRLLLDRSMKIYEVAELVGYADVGPFTKMFRKINGTSPKEWIMNNVGMKETRNVTKEPEED